LGFLQRQCACGLQAARRGSPFTCVTVTGRSPSTSHTVTVPAVTRSLAHHDVLARDIELEVCEARGSSSAVVLPLDDESPAMVRVQRWSLGRLMGHLLFKLQRTQAASVSPRCSCCGRISGGNDPKFVGGGPRSRRRRRVRSGYSVVSRSDSLLSGGSGGFSKLGLKS
jgi:hypothetical protein